jgi:uncharacterized membrane protein
LPGYTSSLGIAINDAGLMVGLCTTQGKAGQGFQCPLNGTPTPIDLIPRALNNNGQIVGTRLVGSDVQAFLWDKGALTPIGVLPGGKRSEPTGINDNGVVIGAADFHDVFYWTAADGILPFRQLLGS